MGSAVSRKRKSSTDSEAKHQQHVKTFCASCGNESAVQQRSERNVGASGAQVLNVEKERLENESVNESGTQHKKFYYYPQKDPSEEETLYVTTSQFPYTKPKAVVVRQHVVNDGVRVQDPVFPQSAAPNVNYHSPAYPKLNAALQEHLGANEGKRPYQAVNDRRWSSPNVVPSSGFMPEKVLPHRTVAELRRTNLNFPSYDHYERFYYQYGGSNRRPPTPSPSAWYPARRTNDYLVASSLLAMERRHDRIQAEKNSENKDIHSF